MCSKDDREGSGERQAQSQFWGKGENLVRKRDVKMVGVGGGSEGQGGRNEEPAQRQPLALAVLTAE